MGVPSFTYPTEDSPLLVPVWVEWNTLKYKGPQKASIVLQEAFKLLHGTVRFFYGDPPPWFPCGYISCVVGYDLGWYKDPATNQQPAGLAPDRIDLAPGPQLPWMRRWFLVNSDARYFDSNGNLVEHAPTMLSLAMSIAHEFGHAVGATEHNKWEPWERPDILVPNARRAAGFLYAVRNGQFPMQAKKRVRK